MAEALRTFQARTLLKHSGKVLILLTLLLEMEQVCLPNFLSSAQIPVSQ